ncbi:hypothetical protein KIPB_010765 [Kipferlia bialata]|uniref:Uncharacterized protein n=1 Tax=Kipferlia bialata TaxID=797122 RepID=A0A9K3D524_9EUKA|nr:hypothetical protein KIPB_010765 [Kipferlia bialata]|eukprot:g10765.t1
MAKYRAFYEAHQREAERERERDAVLTREIEAEAEAEREGEGEREPGTPNGTDSVEFTVSPTVMVPFTTPEGLPDVSALSDE